MSRRRLVPLALAVVALLAVVAVAAHGRPLGTSGGTSVGLPAAFWDYLFTSAVILVALSAIVVAASFFFFRPSEIKPFRKRMTRDLAVLVTVVSLLAFVARHTDLTHLFHQNEQPALAPTTTLPAHAPHRGESQPGQNVHFRWEELAAILGTLLVLGVFGVTRYRLRPTPLRRWVAPEALVAALDESLDDLRTDPDLRRAIVAAYARMEAALAAAGLPRRPAEAPLEYLERALLALDTSGGAVRRLTDLFEWARFSQHEPEPAMRDEAVDALAAVRDELRAAEPAAA